MNASYGTTNHALIIKNVVHARQKKGIRKISFKGVEKHILRFPFSRMSVLDRLQLLREKLVLTLTNKN